MIRSNPEAPRTLEEMGKPLGISKGTLSRYERGYLPNLPLFLAICEHLGIPPRADLTQPPIEGEDLTVYLTRPKTMTEECVEVAVTALKSVVNSDKTLPYLAGESNGVGAAPDEGAQWLTPKQLAKVAVVRIEEMRGNVDPDAIMPV